MNRAPFIVLAAAMVAALWLRLRRRARSATREPGGRRGWRWPRLAGRARFVGTWLVAAREVRERTRSRVFRIGTLVILVAVAAAVVIPVLRRGQAPQVRVGVVGELPAPLRATVVATGRPAGATVRVVAEPSLQAGMRDLRRGRVDVLLDRGERLVVEAAVEPGDTSARALVVRGLAADVALENGLERAGLSPAEAAVLAHPRPLPVTSLQPPKHNDTDRVTALYGLILIFVLLSQYGTWILMGVVEEKASRVVEVLLSTLRPAQLLGGKVLGIGAVALAQAALIVAVALGLAAAVGSDLLKGTAPAGVASALLWLVLGYAFYCWAYAAAGSLAERQEHVQSLVFPLQLPILLGYIASFTALGTGGPSLFVEVLAYLPPTAPFAMPVLVAVGAASWWQEAVAVVLMLAAIVAMARLAGAIYARAILRTGQRVHLREVLSPGT